MSTPTEYLKLIGKMEALRAEHAADKRRAIEERDAAWRARLGELSADYSRMSEKNRRSRPAVAAAEREIAYRLGLIADPLEYD